MSYFQRTPIPYRIILAVALYLNRELIVGRIRQDGTYEMHTAVLSYIRTLDFLGKSARVDFILPYASGRWQGDVNGEFTHIRRRGPGDARARFSVLLYGGPAETPQEFATSKKSNTVVGAALAVTIPTGDYTDKRLINLGSNRWTFRPQLGVTHTRGKWTYEFTTSVYFYTDNNDFFQETQLETDPLLEAQAHLIYSFRPGLWTSVSTAYGWGGEGTINGDAKNNPSGNWLTALSFGFPINRLQGFKVVWLRGRTQKPTGADMDSLGVAYRSLPHGDVDSKVNTEHGGRIVYWSEPDGHVWEVVFNPAFSALA